MKAFNSPHGSQVLKSSAKAKGKRNRLRRIRKTTQEFVMGLAIPLKVDRICRGLCLSCPSHVLSLTCVSGFAELSEIIHSASSDDLLEAVMRPSDERNVMQSLDLASLRLALPCSTQASASL